MIVPDSGKKKQSMDPIKIKVVNRSSNDMPAYATEESSGMDNFAGKVFILANGRSFSGVAEFSSIVKTNNRGLFIGEECGGGYYGNTSGDEANVTFPGSKIIVRIPMIKYTMAIEKLPNGQQGIRRDRVFYHSITDIAEHKDSQLEYALKIVSSK
jgi:hypothetical protein